MDMETVNFEKLTNETPADNKYSQIFFQYDPVYQSLGKVVDIIEKYGGDIFGIRIMKSSENMKKIAIFRLHNKDINDIIMGMTEILNVNVKGCSPVLLPKINKRSL
jgi:hypothetical protein